MLPELGPCCGSSRRLSQLLLCCTRSTVSDIKPHAMHPCCSGTGVTGATGYTPSSATGISSGVSGTTGASGAPSCTQFQGSQMMLWVFSRLAGASVCADAMLFCRCACKLHWVAGVGVHAALHVPAACRAAGARSGLSCDAVCRAAAAAGIAAAAAAPRATRGIVGKKGKMKYFTSAGGAASSAAGGAPASSTPPTSDATTALTMGESLNP